MKKFVVLCTDSDLGRELRRKLAARFGREDEKLSISIEYNVEDADDLVDASTNVIVAVTDVAEDRHAAPSTTPLPAIGFLRHLIDDRNLEIPTVLVFRDSLELEKYNNEAHDATGRVFTVTQGPRLLEKLYEQVERAQSGVTVPMSLKVRIFIEAPLKRSRYQCLGKGFTYDKGDYLNLDIDTVETLLDWGRELGHKEPWEPGFARYGARLMKLLFVNNRLFREHIDRALEQSCIGLANTRVQFFISPEYHDLVLESLREPKATPLPEGLPGDDYWGVVAPLYRKYRGAQNRPLFKDDMTTGRSPINCLIINADLPNGGKFYGPHNGDGTPLWLGPLEHVTKECDDLEAMLKANRRKLNLDKVMQLRPTRGETDFSLRVERELKSTHWHHVHYAGHSYFDSKNDTGYVFLPDEKPCAVPTRKFANWLVNTRFIFVNSCQSGEARFVLDLINHQVPAVCGYRWKVNDRYATEYATVFYEHLFRERSLECAFQSARQHAFRTHRDDRIWASSILVLAA